jgi:putative FmdB family regulatory protein
MPIYEYRCSSCGHELEALQRLSDAPLSRCPSCNADALVKLMSAAGFQLKGSGWYATDFKGSGSKPPAKKDSADSKADTKSAGAGDSASEGKTESKAETKAETKTDTKGGTPPPASGTGAPPAST